MIVEEEDYLAHYGTPRKSGRYPWGSGGNITQRNRSFLDYIESLRGKGISDPEIAKGLDMTTTEFRAKNSIAKNEQKQSKIAMAQRLSDKGYSNRAVGERMAENGKALNESSVRSLLEAGRKDVVDVLQTVANMLREQVAEKEYVDIGSGVENHLVGVSQVKLATAVAILQEEGYKVHPVLTDQPGTRAGHKTKVKVLTPPGTTYKDVVTNLDKIKQIMEFSEDGGRSFLGLVNPLSLNSKRIDIRYAEDGGAEADGVLYVRPGVKDVELGGSRYAQVRVAVDGTHYLKGMAMYKDGLPSGVDIQFNTNKTSTGNKLDAMKPMKTTIDGKIDPDNPFGASIRRQIIVKDADGKDATTSAMNIVNEEGGWNSWSRNLSSQTLSKQSPTLAKTQLNMTYERSKNELDTIMKLTNPAVRVKLLNAFADGADSSAVHLEAAALPRSFWHVILPFNTIKETEVYAPTYRNGERVALVRYPHGGTFEIPELTVNNSHAPAKSVLGQASDAIGINSKVAERLSGADFDGDAVMVIPNNSNTIKTSPALIGLKNFDPRAAYPKYEGMKPMDARTKGVEMGKISNLITDMTIGKASTEDLARAIRHSMVVIDAETHNLNYKESARVNGIAQLKTKYQGSAKSGAATLISKATARADVPVSKARRLSKGGPIDPATGKKVFVKTDETYVNSKGKTVLKTTVSKKLAETDDAFTLSSGTVIEKVYADHSNKLKALANTARKEMVATTPMRINPSAKTAYSNEVKSLDAKLNLVLRNRPLERQALLIAGTQVSARRQANPQMSKDDVKKISYQALAAARARTGAQKNEIHITDGEWNAIQAGAISNNKLVQILNKADLERVKQLATPKTSLLMSSAKLQRAQAMANSGYTQADIADALGVSLTTLKKGLSDG